MYFTEKNLESQRSEKSASHFSVRNMAIGGVAVLLLAGGGITYVYKDKLFGSKEATVVKNKMSSKASADFKPMNRSSTVLKSTESNAERSDSTSSSVNSSLNSTSSITTSVALDPASVVIQNRTGDAPLLVSPEQVHADSGAISEDDDLDSMLAFPSQLVNDSGKKLSRNSQAIINRFYELANTYDCHLDISSLEGLKSNAETCRSDILDRINEINELRYEDEHEYNAINQEREPLRKIRGKALGLIAKIRDRIDILKQKDKFLELKRESNPSGLGWILLLNSLDTLKIFFLKQSELPDSNEYFRDRTEQNMKIGHVEALKAKIYAQFVPQKPLRLRKQLDFFNSVLSVYRNLEANLQRLEADDDYKEYLEHVQKQLRKVVARQQEIQNEITELRTNEFIISSENDMERFLYKYDDIKDEMDIYTDDINFIKSSVSRRVFTAPMAEISDELKAFVRKFTAFIVTN